MDTPPRRSFRRATEQERRRDLIAATQACVAEHGLAGATVREIALKAGVTAGLIRHYFPGKNELLYAAYRATMSQMTDVVKEGLAMTDRSPQARLRHFIEASLTSPVLDELHLSQWAAFISLIRVDEEMRAIHWEAYSEFRQVCAELVKALYQQQGRDSDAVSIERAAIALNALVDGLWIEGCLASERFAEGQLVDIGIASAGAVLGVDLHAPAKAVV